MKILISSLLLILLTISINPQDLSRVVISSAGSSKETLSYSVGEIVIQTRIIGSFILTQGFH